MAEWKTIPEFPNYEASDDGRINGPRRILSPAIDKYGYCRVVLMRGGERFTRQVHRLVLMAFDRDPAPSEQANHIDGNKQNNTIVNLEWVTPLQNSIHKMDILGTGFGESLSKKRGGLTLVAITEILQSTEPHKVIAARFGVSRGMISHIKRGERWVRAVSRI